MPDYCCNTDPVLLADFSNFSQDQSPVADDHAQVESIIDPAYPLPPSAPLETKGSHGRFENAFGVRVLNTRDSIEAYLAAIIHTSHLLRQEALTLLYRNTSFHIGRDQSTAFANENETAAQADEREEITTGPFGIPYDVYESLLQQPYDVF
ncbi:MAG: hypothetical protein L6R37_005130 [Teloschistes peruensis]|nr:MAG: hypothetical protein L6R37_005130 [Teloschistes peruensis]